MSPSNIFRLFGPAQKMEFNNAGNVVLVESSLESAIKSKYPNAEIIDYRETPSPSEVNRFRRAHATLQSLTTNNGPKLAN